MENYKYVEGPPARLCYPSVAFLGDEAVISYDYGEIKTGEKKGHGIKLVVVPVDWFSEK